MASCCGIFWHYLQVRQVEEEARRRGRKKRAVVCGNAPLNQPLSAGASLSEGQWPWMASIQKNQVHVCGGTLVSEDAVLSDAGCLPRSDTDGSFSPFVHVSPSTYSMSPYLPASARVLVIGLRHRAVSSGLRATSARIRILPASAQYIQHGSVSSSTSVQVQYSIGPYRHRANARVTVQTMDPWYRQYETVSSSFQD
ncbi:hypothetical protein WMY93_001861 [Mugilogobius chulae]|uniref:Peptidase S1 domain-containing protein n=1 Tax=Mugilogobius chulae TaxID=88201 RepID=A0AAW0PU54_9GOBI